MKKEREKILIEKSFAYKWKDYPAKASIIFVHGLDGDSEKTWGLFPKLIMGSSLGQNFDVISYGYSSNKILPGSPDIDSLIGEFNSFCQSELRDYEIVILISHSLGSVLVNGMLLKCEQETLNASKYTAHIMITAAFLGGPVWSKFSGSSTARQLASNSKVLKSLQEGWKSSAVKNNIASYVIYGTKDGVVPVPSNDLSKFCFNEYRIQSDHINSPKVKEIDSALYRGVLLAIELSLRFNSRDSRKYFINMILKTDKSDWTYDSSKYEWVLLSDFRFSIASKKMNGICGDDSFEYSSPFKDKYAEECCFYFRYNEISLYEFIFWEAYNKRYLIPAPTIVNGSKVIEYYNYRLATLLQADGKYHDFDEILSSENIVIDRTKDTI